MKENSVKLPNGYVINQWLVDQLNIKNVNKWFKEDFKRLFESDELMVLDKYINGVRVKRILPSGVTITDAQRYCKTKV